MPEPDSPVQQAAPTAPASSAPAALRSHGAGVASGRPAASARDGSPALAASAQALFDAAWQLELAVREDEARPLYLAAIEQSADPALQLEAEFRLGWIALQAGLTRDAGLRLARAVVLARCHELTGPTASHARYWHAVCVEADGRLLDAASLYLQVIDEGDPHLWHEAAYRRLACLAQVGDLSAALRAARHLLACERPVNDAGRLVALRQCARDEQSQIERALAAA